MCFPPKTFPGHMNTIKSLFGDEFKLLIQERIKNFWGYGNLSGDVWFVGMEEGCDGSIPKLINRFKTTSKREVFDIYDDMRGDADHMKWFEEGAGTQSTYRKLIYLLLYLRTHKEPTIEDIREYQIKYFGRKKGDHAALELMPLPCRSLKAKDWVYEASGVEGLSSRREYLKRYRRERVERLHDMIQKYKPRLIIFYSTTYLKDWFYVAGVSFKELLPKNLYVAKNDSTIYAVVPHSTAPGKTNKEWKEIAETILNYL